MSSSVHVVMLDGPYSSSLPEEITQAVLFTVVDLEGLEEEAVEVRRATGLIIAEVDIREDLFLTGLSDWSDLESVPLLYLVRGAPRLLIEALRQNLPEASLTVVRFDRQARPSDYLGATPLCMPRREAHPALFERTEAYLKTASAGPEAFSEEALRFFAGMLPRL